MSLETTPRSHRDSIPNLVRILLAFFRRPVVPRGENDIVLRRLFALVALFLLTSVAHADAKTFRYAYRIDPASLDPHALAETFTLSLIGQIYEPLVGRGKDLELVPALATKWEQIEPKVWRFHLRPNVQFQNG